MIWDNWIIKTRNKLAVMIMEFDSAAAIEGSKLTEKEREDIQKKLRVALDYIDKKLDKVRPKPKK
jgi:hypothetical protein